MSSGPTTVADTTSLDDALRAMDEREFRHLPVVRGGRVVGIVSDRDLLEATGWLPLRVHECRGPGGSDTVPRTVGEIAAAHLVSVAPTDSLTRVCCILVDEAVGCLPVVDGEALLGIVTETDVLRLVSDGLPIGSDGNLAVATVAEYMTADPVAVHWFLSLGEAIALCRDRGVRHLPVLEADVLVGMLTDRDLRRSAGSGWREGTPIDEFVTREVVTIGPLATIREAAVLMCGHRVSGLPVVEDGKLVGMLTVVDILRAVRATLSP